MLQTFSNQRLKTLILTVLTGLSFHSQLQAEEVVLTSNQVLDTIEVKQIQVNQFIAYPQVGWTEEWLDEYLNDFLESKNNQLSLDDLFDLSRAVSVEMKKAGLMFSRAEIPEQNIENGIVNLYIRPGVLGEVAVLDAKRTQSKVLARPFLDLLQKPALRPTMDQALKRLEFLPGIDVFGFFSVTQEPGVSRLNLKVVEERTWTGSLGIDSYGNESTGKSRYFVNGQLLNPLGYGDRMILGVNRTVDYPGALTGSLTYEFPVGKTFNPLVFNVTSSDFDLGQGFSSLTIYGDSVSLSGQYIHRTSNWPKSFQTTLGVFFKKSSIDSEFYPEQFARDTQVRLLSLGANQVNHPSNRFTSIYGGKFSFGNSSQDRTANDFSQENIKRNFVVLETDAVFQFNHPETAQTQFTTSLKGYFGDTELPSVELFPLSGAQGVRSFESGYFSVDQGILARNDVFLPQLKTWPHVTSYFFLDGAYGVRLDENDFDGDQELTGVLVGLGLGLKAQFGDFYFKYEFGQSVFQDFSGGVFSDEELNSINDDKPSNHTFSLVYQLREYE